MEAVDNVVPQWVAGLLGGLSFVILLIVLFVHWKTSNRTGYSSAMAQIEFRQGLLQSAFGGRFLLSVVVSLSFFAVWAVSVAFPLLYVHEKRATTTSAFEKWGNRASINFCEGPDFAYSEYIAEPVNTITAFGFYVAISLVGLCGQGRPALHRQRRFYLCYFALLLIGLGSTALHASLLGSMQGCDELPMLYILTMFGFCTIDSFLGQRDAIQSRALLPIGTFIVTLSATYVYVLNRDEFAVFGVIFATYLAFTVSYLAFYCLGVISVAGQCKLEEEVRHHVVIPLGLGVGACFACGGICWGLEMGFCSVAVSGHFGPVLAPFIWHYVLHSAWHALTAMAAHMATLMFIVIRSQELGWGKPALDWLGVPFISFHDKTS